MKHAPNPTTIAAISSSAGPGGIAVIRLSGPDTEQILKKVFKPAKAEWPLASHHLYLGDIVDPESGDILDQVLCSFMKAPNTYTRENIGEINSHSAPVVTARILECVLHAGAEPAQPGEFTRRAFLSGRIDLSEAEAVAELVAARSRAEADMALNQLEGGLRDEVEAITGVLVDLLAQLEVAVDFPDEDEEIIQAETVAKTLETEAIGPLDCLLEAYTTGRIYREGLEAAIIGRPNVGKSSLLNRLVMREHAIVTAIPGTTRDVLEADALFDGIPVTLQDTAGLHSSPKDEAETEGQKRAEASLKNADLILLVLDQSAIISEEDLRILALADNNHTIVVLNKTDLPPACELDEFTKAAGQRPFVQVSAKTGAGLDELKSMIFELVSGGRTRPDGSSGAVPNARHNKALEDARPFISSIIKGLTTRLPPDLIALDTRQALDFLGLITGQTTTEDVLDRIFSNFCLGK